MPNVEKKILLFLEKHLHIIILICVTLTGFLIRASLRGFLSGDAKYDLLKWYDQIKESGGIRGLGLQVGNYNMLYQFLIALMTYLPIKPLYAYKILSCIFDYLLAFAAAWFIYAFTETNKKWKAIAVYTLVILLPTVFLNSSLWAQCDAIYTFFVLMTFIFLCKEDYLKAFLFYGFAVAFKLQAVFFMPFLLFVYFTRKKFSILYFSLIPAVMCFTSLPCLLMGRRITDIFTIYLEQTGSQRSISLNYPSFWNILSNVTLQESYEIYKSASILFTICLLGGWMVFWIVNRISLHTENMLYMAFILVYTCVLFLPSMHERYGYTYEVLSALIFIKNRKTLPLLCSLQIISLMTYGLYLHESVINMSALSVGNLFVYLCYALILSKEMRESDHSIRPEKEISK